MKKGVSEGGERMVEDIPKSTGKELKYLESPLLFTPGTLTATGGRKRIFCQGLWQELSPVLSQQRLWAVGSLSPLAGFPQRRQPTMSGTRVQVELLLCPQVSFCFQWYEAVCYNPGVQKAKPATFAYLFVHVEGDKYH